MKLTDITCRNAKPRTAPYKLADGGGMYLHIMPHGSKLWRLKYRHLGKENTLSLGSYPQTSLQEARALRESAKATLKGGIDPSSAKKSLKQQKLLSAENTFESIAKEWHQNNLARWTEGHARDILHRLGMDLFPYIGMRPIRDISPPEILSAIRKIEARGAHELARRALQCAGQVFRYGVATSRLESDPTRDLKGVLKPFRKNHFAALETKQLPDFLQVLEKNEVRLYPQTIRAVKLMMHTFVRTSELIGARWEEIDLEKGIWEIPASRMKMRKPHIVPLSSQVIEIFKEQKELTGSWEWVFPNQVRPKKHMSNGTIISAIRRMGYQGKMTGHGFRALAMSTIKEHLGYRHEVVDRQLAHAPRNKVDAAYDRAAFLDERTIMMQCWSDYLDTVASEGKVFTISEKRMRASQ